MCAQAAISAEARDLVSRLIEPDTGERLTAAQALAHPWVAGRGVVGAGGPADLRDVPRALSDYQRAGRFQVRIITGAFMYGGFV